MHRSIIRYGSYETPRGTSINAPERRISGEETLIAEISNRFARGSGLALDCVRFSFYGNSRRVKSLFGHISLNMKTLLLVS